MQIISLLEKLETGNNFKANIPKRNRFRKPDAGDTIAIFGVIGKNSLIASSLSEPLLTFSNSV